MSKAPTIAQTMATIKVVLLMPPPPGAAVGEADVAAAGDAEVGDDEDEAGVSLALASLITPAADWAAPMKSPRGFADDCAIAPAAPAKTVATADKGLWCIVCNCRKHRESAINNDDGRPESQCQRI